MLLTVGAALLAPAAAFAQLSGPEFRVNTAQYLWQSSPDVAVGPSSFVVVWSGAGSTPSGADLGIFAKRFTRSGAPLHEDRVDDTFNPTSYPRVAQGAEFLVVWRQFVDGNASHDIFGRRYSGTSGPDGGVFRINTYTTGTQGAPAIAGDAVHGYVVVWESDDGDGKGIFGQRYSATLAPRGGQFRVNPSTIGEQIRPAVALGGNGSFIVAYQSSSLLGLTGENVFYRRFSEAGAPLGDAENPHEDLSGDQRRPAVSADLPGGFVMAWQSPDGSGAGITARRYASSGAPVTSEFRVNSSTSFNQYRPAVAVTDTGFTVAWEHFQTSDIHARQFSTVGTPTSAEFRVNQLTTGAQTDPRIAAARNGSSYVVVWPSSALDTEHYDIQARKLCLGGDATDNGSVDVADVFFLINHLFAGGTAPAGCADVNGSLTVDVADVFYLISHLFAGGPPPA